MKINFSFFLLIITQSLFLQYNFQIINCEINIRKENPSKSNTLNFLKIPKQVNFSKNTKKKKFSNSGKNKIIIDCNNSLISINKTMFCSEEKEIVNIFRMDKENLKKIELVILSGSKNYFVLKNFYFNQIEIDEDNCSFYLEISRFVFKGILGLYVFLFFF